MVADKVTGDRLPGAGLGHLLVGHGDSIPGVVQVQKYDIENQGGLSRDVATCREIREGDAEDPCVETLIYGDLFTFKP